MVETFREGRTLVSERMDKYWICDTCAALRDWKCFKTGNTVCLGLCGWCDYPHEQAMTPLRDLTNPSGLRADCVTDTEPKYHSRSEQRRVEIQREEPSSFDAVETAIEVASVVADVFGGSGSDSGSDWSGGGGDFSGGGASGDF